MPRNLNELLKKQREEKRRLETEKKEKLIDAVRKQEAIWDRRLDSHRLRDVLDGAWNEVSIETGLPKEECKKCWKGLVDNFRNIFHSATVKKSGAAYDEGTEFGKIKWTFFKSMLFLRDIVARRETSTNYNPTDEDSGTVDVIELADGREFEVEEVLQTTDANEGASKTSCAFDNDVVDINEVTLNEFNETPVNCQASTKSFRENKRAGYAGQDTPNKKKKQAEKGDINAPIIRQLNSLNREIALLAAADKPDQCSVFGEYVATLMRKIPEARQIETQMKIIKTISDMTREDD